MVIIVTGGRDFKAYKVIDSVLSTLHTEEPITLLAQGACGLVKQGGVVSGQPRGADGLAREWATLKGIPVSDFPVDHAVDGPWPAAGPRRNGRMLRAIKDAVGVGVDVGAGARVLVVGFEGGRGTADCLRQAKALGLKTMKVVGTGPYYTEST